MEKEERKGEETGNSRNEEETIRERDEGNGRRGRTQGKGEKDRKRDGGGLEKSNRRKMNETRPSWSHSQPVTKVNSVTSEM